MYAIRKYTGARGEDRYNPKSWAFVMNDFYATVKTFESADKAKRYVKLSWPDSGKPNSPLCEIVRYKEKSHEFHK